MTLRTRLNSRAILVSTVLFLGISASCIADQGLSISKNQAAEEWRWILILSGEIRPGDAQRVAGFIRKQESWPSSIMLHDVPGGFVGEALKLSELIHSTLAPVNIAGVCASACIYLVIAANERRPFDLGKASRVLIHRPFFDPDKFASVPRQEAESLYEELEDDLRSFLRRRNVPSELEEQIFSIPSNRSAEMTGQEFIARIGIYHGPYQEWIISNCGHLQLTEDEQRDYYRLTDSWVDSMSDKSSNFSGSSDGRYFDLLQEKAAKHTQCKNSKLLPERLQSYMRFHFAQDLAVEGK